MFQTGIRICNSCSTGEHQCGFHWCICPNCRSVKVPLAVVRENYRKLVQNSQKPLNMRSLFVGPMSVISTLSFAIAVWKLTLPVIAFLSADWQYIVAALALVEYLMLGIRVNQIAWKIDTKKSAIFKP